MGIILKYGTLKTKVDKKNLEMAHRGIVQTASPWRTKGKKRKKQEEEKETQENIKQTSPWLH